MTLRSSVVVGLEHGTNTAGKRRLYTPMISEKDNRNGAKDSELVPAITGGSGVIDSSQLTCGRQTVMNPLDPSHPGVHVSIDMESLALHVLLALGYLLAVHR
jgi:hypothetical protein